MFRFRLVLPRYAKLKSFASSLAGYKHGFPYKPNLLAAEKHRICVNTDQAAQGAHLTGTKVRGLGPNPDPNTWAQEYVRLLPDPSALLGPWARINPKAHGPMRAHGPNTFFRFVVTANLLTRKAVRLYSKASPTFLSLLKSAGELSNLYEHLKSTHASCNVIGPEQVTALL